jgi:diacylglycerol kinase
MKMQQERTVPFYSNAAPAVLLTSYLLIVQDLNIVNTARLGDHCTDRTGTDFSPFCRRSGPDQSSGLVFRSVFCAVSTAHYSFVPEEFTVLV